MYDPRKLASSIEIWMKNELNWNCSLEDNEDKKEFCPRCWREDSDDYSCSRCEFGIKSDSDLE